MVIEAVLWADPHDSTVVDGWEFDEQGDPAALQNMAAVVGQPPGIRSGTSRWIEWILGRDAAIRAARRAGIEQPVVEVADSGAPYLAGANLSLSIAHTQGLALAAVCSEPIGIDVEKASRNVSTLMRSLHPGEVDLAMSVGVVGCLVAKEAVAKATGLGLGGSLARWPLLDAELSGANPTVSIATPDGQIIAAQLFAWKDYVVGIARIPQA